MQQISYHPTNKKYILLLYRENFLFHKFYVFFLIIFIKRET